MRIFDLHTHILPDCDDGAKNIEQALEMLENAIAADVTKIMITPHCNVEGTKKNHKDEQLIRKFNQLLAASKDMPIEIFLGAEVRYTENLAELLQRGIIPTLNNSRYLLTEFPKNYPAEFFCEALQSITAQGFTPIIAHPERYDSVIESCEIVYDWLDIGCHIQITAGSIRGDFGKKVKNTSDFLLKNDLVCCVASDAHGTLNRSNFISDIYTHLSLYYGKQYANILMWDNPLRISLDNTL